MIPDRKVQAQQHVDLLQASAGTPEVKAITALLGLLFEEAKHNLITASGDELLRGQGDARTYQSLIRKLERRAPSANREQ